MLDQTLVVGPFQCNCRLLACERTGLAALIDPGDEPQKILKTLEGAKTKSGLPIRVTHLLHTHGHLDHIGATRGVKTAHPDARIHLHKGDEFIYQMLPQQGAMFGIQYEPPLPIDAYLEHEQELAIGSLKFTVIHTPGHSPGSVGLRLHEDTAEKIPETLFSGDTLFQGSVGRTDLWGADQDQMFANIRTRFLTLDDDTRVCPGHGPETTIGIERRENPFLL